MSMTKAMWPAIQTAKFMWPKIWPWPKPYGLQYKHSQNHAANNINLAITTWLATTNIYGQACKVNKTKVKKY